MEVFKEDYIPHVPGRYGRKGNVMCITVPVEEHDKKFIMDSGSGHDLIAAGKVERMDLMTYQDDAAVNFHTANGVTVSTSKVDLEFKAFEETANVHVLEDQSDCQRLYPLHLYGPNENKRRSCEDTESS